MTENWNDDKHGAGRESDVVRLLVLLIGAMWFLYTLAEIVEIQRAETPAAVEASQDQ